MINSIYVVAVNGNRNVYSTSGRGGQLERREIRQTKCWRQTERRKMLVEVIDRKKRWKSIGKN